MSNNTQTQARSFALRTRDSLRKLGRDRRGAELVEIMVVIAIFALGGIAAMNTLSGKVGEAAGKVGDKVVKLEKW